MIRLAKHKREFAIITGVMIALNLLQLFFTQLFFELRFNLQGFASLLRSAEELNAILLHILAGLLFGLIFSYLFARYQESEASRAQESRDSMKKLAEAYEGLRELDRLKSKFITVVSHQIRTPLNSIR